MRNPAPDISFTLLETPPTKIDLLSRFTQQDGIYTQGVLFTQFEQTARTSYCGMDETSAGETCLQPLSAATERTHASDVFRTTRAVPE